jgi:hypothetical protein
MGKILFLTNRNILTTSGELRLIKNRAEELYNTYGIATDFIALQKPSRINAENKEPINAGGRVDVYPLSISHPFTTISSFKAIKNETINRVLSGDYNMVMISSFALAPLAKVIRKIKPRMPIVMDLHGAAEDSLELAKVAGMRKKIFFYIVYNLISITYRRYYRFASGSMVVTEALEEYVKKNYTIPSNFHFYRIPCATSTTIVNEIEYVENRKKYRAKYSIADNEIVFIYSGGVSSWQCVEETIQLYKDLSKQINRKTRMLIFSHNIEYIKALAGNDTTIQTDSYGALELSKALCAGDYAFLLRKDCVTNNVAFPNKFLEYVQSGLRVITTPYVYEVYKQVSANNLGEIYLMDNNISNLVTLINEYQLGSNFNKEKIERVLYDNCFANRIRNLAADIK